MQNKQTQMLRIWNSARLNCKHFRSVLHTCAALETDHPITARAIQKQTEQKSALASLSWNFDVIIRSL